MHDLHPERAGRQDIGDPLRPLHQRHRLRIVEELIHAEGERRSGVGDPVEINVRGYELSLRKEEAARIEVE